MSHPAPPVMTDTHALARQRAGATVDVLHRLVRAELQERLAEVNRTFTRPAIVTGHPQFWADFLPDARLIGDADVLEVEAGAHDLVIHAMALHWSNDPVGQLVQARRALAPDGLFLGVQLGGQTLQELRSVLAQAEADLTGSMTARVLPMAEIRDLGALLQRAGLALPVADSVLQRASYRDLFHLAGDLRAMGEGNALAARARSAGTRSLFARAAALYAQHYPAPPDRIAASFEFIFLTGWAPADSQPRPLRPGSAKARLADALGVRETPLPAAVPDNEGGARSDPRSDSASSLAPDPAKD